jgi:CSLREA domain-containing protein
MAQRQVALDPYWEEGQRTLMRLLADAGQRNAALSQYEELRELLADELAVEPEPATTALCEEIRSGRVGADVGYVLGRLGRDRRVRVRLAVLAILLGLSFVLYARLKTGSRGGSVPWDPSATVEGISLWPQIDLKPWGANPIIMPGAPGSWDEMVLAPAALDLPYRILLYYTGARDWPDGSITIGVAGSSSGTRFGPSSYNNPRLKGDGTGFDAWGVGVPVLFLDGDLLQLYYAGVEASPFGRGLAIGRATAETQQAAWLRDPEPVLEPGGPDEWDSCAVIPGSVVVSEGAHTLYYLGSSAEACTQWMVGMAFSADGVWWTKHDNPETEETPFAESDPVLTSGSPGAWDGANLTGVAVRDTGRGWEMFYSAEGEDGRSAIGYAWSVEGIRWHRHPDNPVLEPEEDPYAAKALQVHSITYDGSTHQLYYDYGLGNGLGVAEGIVRWPIVVDTTKDELNSDGDCSLREAIEAANRDAAVDNCPAGCRFDRVIVPAGTYRLSLHGADEDDNQSGDLDILDDLTLLGAGAETTILDGDGADRLLHNHGARLDLKGLTLTNGRAPAVSRGDGGGLYNHSGSVTVERCVISKNVGSWGGGISNKAGAGATGTMVLTDTRVVGNTARGNGGGIIQVSAVGGISATLTMTITRSTIADNRAEGTFRPSWSGGGGIASGLHMRSAGSAATLTLIDSTVSGNVAAGEGELLKGVGGGIGITGGEATIINCTVSGNRAIGVGPASGLGGGLWVTASFGPATVTLINSTVSDNSALSGGGGVAATSLSWICGETVDPSGWCADFLPFSPAGPTVMMQNTIVADNRAPAGAACLPRESLILSRGHNLEDGDSCHLDQFGDLTNRDPTLDPLADNGGPTWTQAPLEGSAAVDAGSCSDLIVDQRGLTRPVDLPGIPNLVDGCDIGAVELQVD